MKWPMWGILIFLYIGLTDQSLKQLPESTHLGSMFGFLRDFLALGLWFWGMSKVSFYGNRRLTYAVFGMLIFINLYVLESILLNRHLVGLYYARSYALPPLFYLGCYAAISNCDTKTLAWILRRHAWLNIGVLLFAFLEYALIMVDPRLAFPLFGPGQVSASWFISGGLHMRMGLPFVAPNTLGTYSAMSALLALLVLWSGTPNSGGRALQKVSLVISLCALIGSLSRSGVLLLLTGLFVLFSIPGFVKAVNGRRIVTYAVLLTVLGATVLAGLEILSDGYISRWVGLTLRGNDPSLAGHLHTFKDAYDNFYKYYIYGYPRGTVGPKAILFGNTVHNVENSTVALVYEVGLPAAVVFMFLYLCMLSSAWVGRVQLTVAFGFFVNAQFLPYIFEPELICYFLFIYVLIGVFVRNGNLQHLLDSVANKSKRVPYSVPKVGVQNL